MNYFHADSSEGVHTRLLMSFLPTSTLLPPRFFFFLVADDRRGPGEERGEVIEGTGE